MIFVNVPLLRSNTNLFNCDSGSDGPSGVVQENEFSKRRDGLGAPRSIVTGKFVLLLDPVEPIHKEPGALDHQGRTELRGGLRKLTTESPRMEG